MSAGDGGRGRGQVESKATHAQQPETARLLFTAVGPGIASFGRRNFPPPAFVFCHRTSALYQNDVARTHAQNYGTQQGRLGLNINNGILGQE